ncbi:PEP-CTERM sorting domain-containing protein [Sphingomonas sp. MA1305]|uniref:PEPxxWA-CTERM sorting domain-containing protein n=1 Tax=Sphingomonas sp. MA1305 TaxID=2479204 RepID=UPI0018DF6799|nr:PEPxxWA-CTERM sorting domain-containing protein [Sphingomonas sp. MA1305]MBI0477208.1 PEP-CTERM sorting domain-containing protein [Sphingomonas sp. MA1305]
MKKLLSLLAAGAAVCAASNANAATIATGSSVDFTGYLNATGGNSLSTATALDFLASSGGTASPGVAGLIPNYGTGTGTFAGFSCMTGTCGTIQDIANFRVGAQSIANFFVLTGGNNASPISFDLSSIDTIGSITANTLAFAASGTLRYDGFDATPASFVFTTQGNTTTSFSATAQTAAVPEPATWALMILGMGAVGFAMRRRNTTTRVRFA